MKNSVAIIDFGTSRITVLIGSRGINGTVNIDGIGICGYAGFVGGEWLDVEGLGAAVAQATAVAESSARLKINKLYVGVPGDFLSCETGDVTMSLGKKRRVTDSDVADLHARGNMYFDDAENTVINIQPIYYTLDDDRKLIAPVGMPSSRLGGSISYILASKEFIRLIDAAAANAGISETEYVAAPLAEMLLLFDDYKRDNCVMLADVGALGTTVSIGRGDGLCGVYYFPWGGECITDALADGLGVSRDDAERLKCRVNLSLNPAFDPEKSRQDDDTDGDDDEVDFERDEQSEERDVGIMQTEYVVETRTERITYPVAMTNSIVENEIERFARYIDKTLAVCDYDYPEFIPLSITGGGLIKIRGASEKLSEFLEREVEEAMPSQPLLNRPQLSSALGLIDMVLRSEQPYESVFGRIKRWFSRR